MLASPPVLAPDHAVVESAEVAYDEPALRGTPITSATLRDSRGAIHAVRIVGGPNRNGGVTRLAGHVVPIAGAVVRLDLASEAGAPLRNAWTRGDPPATWSAAALPVAFAIAAPLSNALGDASIGELDVALRTWPLVSCTAWRTRFAGVASAPAADDGVNAAYFHDDAWPSFLVAGALAQTIVSTDAQGALHDADIHVNGVDFRWSTDGASGTYDVRGVFVHELGHALGLGHSTDARATMFVTHAPGLAWRSLEQDDRDGVCALYPRAGNGAPNASDCESGAPCPADFVCVAKYCERRGARGEVCAPCARVPGACEGSGDDARCVDVDAGGAAGRVCGRACTTNEDCGPRFACAPTTSSGDLQCVARDGCAAGPDRCTVDADCAESAGGARSRCVAGACMGAPDDADAGVSDANGDAAQSRALSSGGGCSVALASSHYTRARSRVAMHAWGALATLMILRARALRRRRRRSR